MQIFVRGITAAVLALTLMLSVPAPRAAAQDAVTVDGLLKAMTDTLTGASSITLHVEKTFDDILVSGHKVQYSGAIDIALRRPDRLYVSYGDDFASREVWFDGNQFVLQDHLARVHGQLPAAGTVDATLDALAEQYGVVMPLAGLLGDDVQQLIDENLSFRLYINLSDVEGVPAHHLLLGSAAADWQIWIDAGETPLPLKIVVTDTTEPGEPQQTFLFTDWNLAADLPESMFTPEIPGDSALAAFLPKTGD
ncbi:MAG: DUF2092 domain-containing protein [Proteobacteria bacterium]|nr:DUF2092 domain-containing protein [Pseudomonadota bacterium]